jgi:hypothetical protein
MLLKIYCFGDSHAWFFRDLKDCISIPIGPRLAYNLENLAVYEILHLLKEHLEIEKPDKYYVLLTFGEIDIRAHLIKNNNLDECIKRYINAILMIKTKVSNIIVFGPIASTRRLEDMQDEEFPVIGTCFERNKIAKEFNEKLSLECEINNIEYFSIIDKLIDENGLTIEKYYLTDRIHLSKSAIDLVQPLLSTLTTE